MIKNLFNQLSILIIASAALYVSISENESFDFSKYSTQGEELKYTAECMKPSEEVSHDDYDAFSMRLGKSYVGFKEALAFKESQGNYFSVNNFGYLGKYQFGKETLKLIGVYNPKQFLYSPVLQEEAFIANMKRNKWILRKDIEWFVGKRIGGIVITESGMLAAAHLAGPGNVKKYLRSYGKKSVSDAFGSSVEYYMKKFSGYDTSYIKPNRRAKVSKS